MSVMTIISRFTGLLRWSAIGAALGLTASHYADAYNLAYNMPNMVYELVLGGVLTSVFIPTFVEYREKDSPEAAWEAANRILTLAIVLLCLMTVVCWILTPFLVRIQTFAGNNQLRHQAEFFFYFFAPTIIFFGIGAIFSGMLNTYKKFFIPAATPILNNLLFIVIAALYYYFPKVIGLGGLALGTTIGVALMAFAQVPALYRLGWRYHWKLDMKDPVIGKFFTLAAPMFLYVGLNQLALMTRNNFAASIQGGLAAMTYGYTFFQLPYGIFSVTITTVLYPALSQYAVNKDWDNFRTNFSQGVRWSAFIIIPCAVGYFILAEPIIRLIMERGMFKGHDTVILARVLACYSIALLPYTLTLLTTRTFYALQDTRTPTWVILVGLVMTFAGCFILVKPFGIPGIAIAYGLQYFAMAAVLLTLLRKKIRRLDGTRISITMIKSLIASLFMGGVVWVIYQGSGRVSLLGLSPLRNKFLWDLMVLGVCVVLGGLTYLGMSILLKTDEVKTLKEFILRRRSRLS